MTAAAAVAPVSVGLVTSGGVTSVDTTPSPNPAQTAAVAQAVKTAPSAGSDTTALQSVVTESQHTQTAKTTTSRTSPVSDVKKAVSTEVAFKAPAKKKAA